MDLLPELKEYAERLLAEGFRVYVPKNWRGGTFFFYSREVDGKTCYGNVQKNHFSGYSHYMPIKPSKESGSSMFVGHDDDPVFTLTIEDAKRTARPSNNNPVVGTHVNWYDARELEKGFDELKGE